MANLRQKTWGIFIKPYFEHSKEKLVHRGTVSASNPFSGGGAGSYVQLKQGEAYMLYKTTTSFVEAREIVKEIMDDFGYSKKDIVVTEMIPIDHMITPLA